MKPIQSLFTANKAIHIDQRRIGGDALPLAHHALRVNDFTRQHGASVHGKLQDVNGFFAAVHFHVRARRDIESTALRFLRRPVIEQAPKRANGAIAFDAAIVNVDGARIGGGDLLPFCASSKWRQQGQDEHKWQNKCKALFQRFCKFAMASLRLQGGLNDIHAPYYKVVHSS